MARTPLARLTKTALTLTLGVAMFLPACRAPEEDRLGYIGEFCAADDQCREPYICENNQCIELATAGTITCAEMCTRLVDECGRDEPNCAASCRETINGWSDEAVDTFGACVLGDTEPQLTCEQAREENGPNFCYLQIPMPAARQERCDGFVETARDYAVDPSDDALTGLRQRCYILARTRPEETWSNTSACLEEGSDITEAEVVTCLNEVFQLDPALTAPLAADPPTGDDVDDMAPAP